MLLAFTTAYALLICYDYNTLILVYNIVTQVQTSVSPCEDIIIIVFVKKTEHLQ